MNIAIVVASSALALILALAFARERRIWRALQRLLAKLFTSWRTQHAENHESDSGDDDANRARHDRVR